jgi:hypothetical protein
MAFTVYGPFAPAKDLLIVMEVGEHPDDKKQHLVERHVELMKLTL